MVGDRPYRVDHRLHELSHRLGFAALCGVMLGAINSGCIESRQEQFWSVGTPRANQPNAAVVPLQSATTFPLCAAPCVFPRGICSGARLVRARRSARASASCLCSSSTTIKKRPQLPMRTNGTNRQRAPGMASDFQSDARRPDVPTCRDSKIARWGIIQSKPSAQNLPITTDNLRNSTASRDRPPCR